MTKKYDIIVIGGGFYGCMLALFFKKRFRSVLLVEKENEILTRASYNNQARVHNGYHYPRSYITALRSHVNYSKFIKDYKGAIYSNFKQYYAIASNLSKTTAVQFVKFCDNVGIPIKDVSEGVKKLFNMNLIEDVFETEECVFDANKLRALINKLLRIHKVNVVLNKQIDFIEKKNGKIRCISKKGGYEADKVFICAYSGINMLLKNSKLPLFSLKHEFTEMPLIKVPPILSKMSVTIMDGPFFGFLPFPDRDCHSLWHVRYAVHESETKNIELTRSNFKSNYVFMIKDAARFIPTFSQSKYIESIFEVKTVLLNREESDGRPILYKANYGMDGLHVVMGSKIDNIYDCVDAIQHTLK